MSLAAASERQQHPKFRDFDVKQCLEEAVAIYNSVVNAKRTSSQREDPEHSLANNKSPAPKRQRMDMFDPGTQFRSPYIKASPGRLQRPEAAAVWRYHPEESPVEKQDRTLQFRDSNATVIVDTPKIDASTPSSQLPRDASSRNDLRLEIADRVKIRRAKVNVKKAYDHESVNATSDKCSSDSNADSDNSTEYASENDFEQEGEFRTPQRRSARLECGRSATPVRSNRKLRSSQIADRILIDDED